MMAAKLPRPNVVGAEDLSEDEVRALERQVEATREAARRLEGVRDQQTGSIRGAAKRKAKRKQQRQARKRNR